MGREPKHPTHPTLPSLRAIGTRLKDPHAGVFACYLACVAPQRRRDSKNPLKPHGKNKEIFDKMTQEHKKTRKHITAEADRIIKETKDALLEAIEQHTQPLPDHIQVATMMVGTSTSVRVLNLILQSEGLQCKGQKSDKAAFLATSIPLTSCFSYWRSIRTHHK